MIALSALFLASLTASNCFCSTLPVSSILSIVLFKSFNSVSDKISKFLNNPWSFKSWITWLICCWDSIVILPFLAPVLLFLDITYLLLLAILDSISLIKEALSFLACFSNFLATKVSILSNALSNPFCVLAALIDLIKELTSFAE